MRGFERLGNLPSQVHSLLGRKRTAQRRAFDILHHQVIRSDVVVRRANMRMVKGSDRPGLAFESVCVGRVQELDRHRAVQACIARSVDFPHAAGADSGEDLIGSQTSPNG
jgi:hypothetical protein